MHNQQRYLSLDIFKALGIIYIIILHHFVWLFVLGDIGGLTYKEGYRILFTFGCRTGLHVLGFGLPLLAGTTYYLALKAKDLSWHAVLKRAFYLSALGFLMNLLAWGFFDIFDWDVLQFIAVSMLISYPFLKKTSAAMGLSVLTVLGGVALFYSSKFPFADFHDSYLYAIVFGSMSGEQYWPLCPWFFIFAAGLWLGYLFLSGDNQKLAGVILIGILFLGISLLSGKFFPVGEVEHVWGPSLFKPSPLFVLGITGFHLTVVPLAHLALERMIFLRNAFQNRIIHNFSMGILWIYIITTIIGYNVITDIIFRFFYPSFRQAVILLPILISANLLLAYFIGDFVSKRRNKQRLT